MSDNESLSATKRAEAQKKRAETRQRRALLKPHTELPPLRLRGIVAKLPSDDKGAITHALETAGVRPTPDAIRAGAAAWKDVRDLRNKKRNRRKNLERRFPNPFAKRVHFAGYGRPVNTLQHLRITAIQSAVMAVMPFGAPAGTDWRIKFLPPGQEEKASYSLTTTTSWDVYRGHYKGWAANGDKHEIAVPRDWRISVERRGLGTVAGAFTLRATSRPAPYDGVELVEALVAKPGRGYSCTVEARLYARTTGGGWVHIEEDDITPNRSRISRCGNQERRRVMLQIYGFARYLTEVKATCIDESRYGKLYRWLPRQGEPVVAVEVADATDPTRRYMLRVPPHCRTAHEAVAWTFGLPASEYNPEIET